MASGAWLLCPRCGLRHSARADGRCPRCGAALGAPERGGPGAGRSPSGRSPAEGPRRGGILLAGLVAVSGAAAFLLLRGGARPGGAKALGLGDGIESEPVASVSGPGWRYQVPAQQWYVSIRRFPDFEGEDGVTLERALVRPGRDAFALLFSKAIPAGRGFDLDALASERSKAWARELKGFRLHDAGPLPGRGGARAMHWSARVEGVDFEALSGLYPNPPSFRWLVVAAPVGDFAALRDEFDAVLASVRSDTPPPEPAPTPTYLQKAFSDLPRGRRAPEHGGR
ncbi:MAG TPA: hypothetical protein VMN04_06435 [Thermoanaerobaculia bacterium]|nr:hypothetical protein [Thermoanaerobaculia bacterium]